MRYKIVIPKQKLRNYKHQLSPFFSHATHVDILFMVIMVAVCFDWWFVTASFLKKSDYCCNTSLTGWKRGFNELKFSEHRYNPPALPPSPIPHHNSLTLKKYYKIYQPSSLISISIGDLEIVAFLMTTVPVFLWVTHHQCHDRWFGSVGTLN